MVPDRRSNPRYPCLSRATIALAGTRRSATVLELSMGGALVRPGPEARRGLAPGTHCALRILSADDRELLVVPARVAHAAGGRAGLALDVSGCVAERMLRQLIEFNLGINALAGRDARARQSVC